MLAKGLRVCDEGFLNLSCHFLKKALSTKTVTCLQIKKSRVLGTFFFHCVCIPQLASPGIFINASFLLAHQETVIGQKNTGGKLNRLHRMLSNMESNGRW